MMSYTVNVKVNNNFDSIQNMVAGFARNDLHCIFLREERFLAPDEDDLDFWCSVDEKERVVDVIHDQGWFLIGGRSCGNKRGKSQVLRFRKSGMHPVFELWIGDLRADALIYCTASEIVNNSAAKGDLFLLSDEFLLNILILRPILKRRNLKKYIDRASQLSVTEEQLDDWLEQCHKKFGKKVAGLCKKALIEDPGYLGARDIFHLLLDQYGVLASIKLLWQKLSGSIANLTYRPPLVSFIGTDGSGKSTTAEALLDFIKKQNIKARYVYAGRSRNNSKLVAAARFIIFKLGLAKKISEEEWRSQAIADDKSGKKEAGSVIQVIALLVYFMEYHFRYLKIKLLSRFDKEIQILDRGSWDIATIAGLGKLPVWLARRCPQSDITFFCYARPKIIQERKMERSFHEIIRHQSIYKYLGRCSDNVFVYLDTTTEMAELNQLVAQYFSAMVAMHNGWLDKETAKMFFAMKLSIWEKQSY
jgi:hypothetical protein